MIKLKYASLVSNSLKKNFYKAYKTIHHITSSKKYTVIQLNEFTKFPKDNLMYPYIKMLTSEILQFTIIRNNFTREYIENEILLILETIIIENGFNLNKQDFYSCCEDLVKKLELKINRIIENEFHDYECIFHIDNIDEIPDIEIGEVNIFKAKNVEEYTFELDDLDVENVYVQENKFYAKTTVYGSKKYAVRKAESNIKIALNILKLFLPDFYCNFNVEGSNYVMVDRKNIIISSEGKNFVRKLINSSRPCKISNNELKSINKELNQLSNLFKNQNRTEFENKILIATYWFGESISIPLHVYDNKLDNEYDVNLDNLEYFDVYPKLLNIIIALETLFVWGNENKAESISSKTAVLIANPGYEEHIYNFIKKIYDNRSKIVHSGIVYISENNLNELIYYTRIAILTLVKLNEEYRDKIRCLNKLK